MTSTRESQRGKYFRTFIWGHSCVAVAWYRCRFWNCEWCEFCEWHYWRVGSCRVTWVPAGMQGQATLSRHWSCPASPTILQMENQTSVVPTIARIIGKTICHNHMRGDDPFNVSQLLKIWSDPSNQPTNKRTSSIFPKYGLSSWQSQNTAWLVHSLVERIQQNMSS